MRLVLGLYIAEPLQDWIRDIVQGNADWANIKAAILQSAKSKYNVKTKIEYLMNLKLNEDERKKIKQCYPEMYKKTKEWALKIEKFEKSDKFNLKKANVVGEELANQTDLNVDRLANIFSELKICQISQNSKVEKDIRRIDRLESSISELTKLVKNIANNKNQSNQNQPACNTEEN
ncbi:41066_t:CDS:2 [Gigaspora margarita]|uniref:41066_t:CDS:1 n=1 Tax=Gigaspora margarita TaxID=4874 RepID=A0ABM8W1C3_GIGMA|nr:41066_t:CDS:2 [Gigaspora margarita]